MVEDDQISLDQSIQTARILHKLILAAIHSLAGMEELKERLVQYAHNYISDSVI